MIISPRAEEIVDIRRKEGNGFINIDEVFLYCRSGAGAPYRKILYWKRGADSHEPPPPKLTSFAIVPEMTKKAVRLGHTIPTSTVIINMLGRWCRFLNPVLYEAGRYSLSIAGHRFTLLLKEDYLTARGLEFLSRQ